MPFIAINKNHYYQKVRYGNFVSFPIPQVEVHLIREMSFEVSLLRHEVAIAMQTQNENLDSLKKELIHIEGKFQDEIKRIYEIYVICEEFKKLANPLFPVINFMSSEIVLCLDEGILK